MKLLLLNTCGAEGSFALSDTSISGSPQLVTMPGRSASEMLVRLLREATDIAGWRMQEIEVIGVVTGPGSFTGVRVGLSVAKGLSEAVGAKLIAVSRLKVLATSTALLQKNGLICALLDAGRGEFYCGSYLDGESLSESLLSLDAAIAVARVAAITVVCEESVEKALAGRLDAMRLPEPTAADALPLVLRCIERGEFADAPTLDANYLRRTDAEIFSSAPRPRTG